MPKQTADRKKEILSAALVEFSQKGFSGARLQAIADNIGVTKAMIHYYFNTKEGLFRAVFDHACGEVMAGLLDILESDEELFTKLERFVSESIERFHAEPALVGFIVCELNRDPESTSELLRDQLKYDPTLLERQLNEAASNYEIASVSANQLLVTMLSLCMFPYAGRAFVNEVIDPEKETSFDAFLEQRKGIVTDTIFNWLTA